MVVELAISNTIGLRSTQMLLLYAGRPHLLADPVLVGLSSPGPSLRLLPDSILPRNAGILRPRLLLLLHLEVSGVHRCNRVSVPRLQSVTSMPGSITLLVLLPNMTIGRLHFF